MTFSDFHYFHYADAYYAFMLIWYFIFAAMPIIQSPPFAARYFRWCWCFLFLFSPCWCFYFLHWLFRLMPPLFHYFWLFTADAMILLLIWYLFRHCLLMIFFAIFAMICIIYVSFILIFSFSFLSPLWCGFRWLLMLITLIFDDAMLIIWCCHWLFDWFISCFRAYFRYLLFMPLFAISIAADYFFAAIYFCRWFRRFHWFSFIFWCRAMLIIIFICYAIICHFFHDISSLFAIFAIFLRCCFRHFHIDDIYYLLMLCWCLIAMFHWCWCWLLSLSSPLISFRYFRCQTYIFFAMTQILLLMLKRCHTLLFRFHYFRHDAIDAAFAISITLSLYLLLLSFFSLSLMMPPLAFQLRYFISLISLRRFLRLRCFAASLIDYWLHTIIWLHNGSAR